MWGFQHIWICQRLGGQFYFEIILYCVSILPHDFQVFQEYYQLTLLSDHSPSTMYVPTSLAIAQRDLTTC